MEIKRCNKTMEIESSREIWGKGETSGGNTTIENILVENWKSLGRMKNYTRKGAVVLDSGCLDSCLNPLVIQALLLNALGLSQTHLPFSHQIARYFSAPSLHVSKVSCSLLLTHNLLYPFEILAKRSSLPMEWAWHWFGLCLFKWTFVEAY